MKPKQGSIFDTAGILDPRAPTYPICHTNDPETSRIAAEQHTESGKQTRNAEMVLALVAGSPGRTAIELWANASTGQQNALKEPQEVRRRLTDLESAGRIRKGDARKCSRRGTLQVTWYAV